MSFGSNFFFWNGYINTDTSVPTKCPLALPFSEPVLLSFQWSLSDLLVATWHSFTKIQLPWKGDGLWNSTLSIKYLLSSDQALRYLTEGFMWYLLRKFVIWLYNVLVFLDEQARAWWKYIGGLPATVVSNTGKAIRVRF